MQKFSSSGLHQTVLLAGKCSGIAAVVGTKSGDPSKRKAFRTEADFPHVVLRLPSQEGGDLASMPVTSVSCCDHVQLNGIGMKSPKITNISEIRNELNRYKRGKKFDIHQFNQVARLAWLGRVVMQPLDPEDPQCGSCLLFVQEPEELAAHFLDTDQELLGAMHIVDGEQAKALIQVLRSGVEERAKLFEDLSRSDFYFRHFYHSDEAPQAETESQAGSRSD